MQIALWFASGLLALAMLVTGAMKLATPRVELAKRFGWAATWTDRNVKLLGLAEVLGAVGLVAPAATGILPVLAPLAAACLAVLMLGAVKLHIARREPFVAPALLAALGVFIAIARFGAP